MRHIQLLQNLMFVGGGGFLGAAARYLLSLLPCRGDFPFATFLTNFGGAVLIGALAGLAGTLPAFPPRLLLLLKTGLCGGFTTFSTFSLETVSLFEKGKWALGMGYAAGSVCICLVGVLLGRCLVQGLRSLLRF